MCGVVSYKGEGIVGGVVVIEGWGGKVNIDFYNFNILLDLVFNFY